MTFQQIISAILGSYTPVTYQVGEDIVIASGLAGVDWSFVLGGLLLVVTVASVFRIIGGIVSGVFR